jgi:fatty-acid desaturase
MSAPTKSADRSLQLPEPALPVKLAWGYLISITSVHLLSLLALLPYYFSWTGVVLAIVGHYVYGLLGITLCYHRLLTHQGLVVPKWLERTFATLGVCSLEDTPARWVAIHRMHHKHSDERDDPHSPLVNFLWSHVGWLFIQHREHSTIFFYEKYARDVLRDPYYLWLERKLAWFWVYALHVVAYYVVAFPIGWWLSGTVMGGVQFGSSVVVWGVFVRTVTVWHGTWSVNSLTHVLGYRNYKTKDDSRNMWAVAIWAHGEGWHNNHHADQRAAAHGHRWWEFDPTYFAIRVLMMLGLAKEVVLPRSWTKGMPPMDDAEVAASGVEDSRPAADNVSAAKAA